MTRCGYTTRRRQGLCTTSPPFIPFGNWYWKGIHWPRWSNILWTSPIGSVAYSLSRISPACTLKEWRDKFLFSLFLGFQKLRELTIGKYTDFEDIEATQTPTFRPRLMARLNHSASISVPKVCSKRSFDFSGLQHFTVITDGPEIFIQRARNCRRAARKPSFPKTWDRLGCIMLETKKDTLG